ncbi:hypothetical protein HanIR_Chr08g0358091 [Helianthus annuus]|nr:hypothetical protein HanIR_Chr08g0358091 [Helianthus annuus]
MALLVLSHQFHRLNMAPLTLTSQDHCQQLALLFPRKQIHRQEVKTSLSLFC